MTEPYVLEIIVNYISRDTLCDILAGLHTVFAISKFSFVA